MAELRQAVASGQHWFIALLRAMALWTAPEEHVDGRHYRYLIGGEAFDWLLLAERLCLCLDGFIPQEEKEALLLEGRPPLEMSQEEFRRLLGEAKYRAHLNYFYGITVEEALQLATMEEVHKELYGFGLAAWAWEEEAAFQRLYGKPRRELLAAFRAERGLPPSEAISLAELKEFTYWLFKYRLRHSEPARLASDTRKALHFLARLQERQARRQGPKALDLPGP